MMNPSRNRIEKQEANNLILDMYLSRNEMIHYECSLNETKPVTKARQKLKLEFPFPSKI
jgi:hypothetical protein